MIPASNPMTKGKVELGKQLYFDQRISKDSTISCASCHDPAKGWTDNAKFSTGIGGQVGGRSAPTVLNTVYGRTMFWDGRAASLEAQAQGPVQNKIEMGDQSYKQIIERLRQIPGYREQFMKVFGDRGDARRHGQGDRRVRAGPRFRATRPSTSTTGATPTRAATFTLLLNESEKRGMVLFGLRLRDEGPLQGRRGAPRQGQVHRLPRRLELLGRELP